jgi:N-acetylglucosaminyl-diphospho-decaprenol L-rhamnosyltransferase
MSPNVAVLIVNWNTCDLLAACLASVQAHTQGLNVQMLVVDNASTDTSVEMVHERYPEALLLANTDNIGFVSGNNQAYAASDPSMHFVLLLNSDAELLPGALKTMVDWLEAYPKAGACGPLTLNTDGTLQPTWSRFPTVWDEMRGIQDRRFLNSRRSPRSDVSSMRALPGPQPTGWVGGSCLLVRREAIERDLEGVLLDPVFSMYSEETDLCFRLQRRGWEVFFVPTAEVIHHGGQSSKQSSLRTLTLMYQSKTLFFQRHYGSSHALRLRLGLALMAALKWLILALKGPAGGEQRRRQGAVLRALWG